MDDLQTAMADVFSGWRATVPPNRVRVSQGVASNLFIKVPGGASGYYDPTLTPYMVEPTDMLGSRRHSAVCFVGPARTGKSVSLITGWFAHALVNDPGDMAIFQMTQDKAREFVRSDIDRALRNSPTLRAMKTANTRDDNTHDKWFRNGMLLKIAWPTVSNMSSSTYRYVAGTDYDRWPDNIDGEGDGFTLMAKRTTTFLSRGMVAVESSPGRPITDPTWVAGTPHEAPPVEGILGIYNRSDRRRQYWKCPHCREWFQAAPGLGLFGLPDDDTLLADVRTLNIDRFAKQYARVICPTSGCVIYPHERDHMNQTGRWLADGLALDGADRVHGTPRTSTIAGYWMGGVAAAYTTWEMLVRKHLQALLDYELTGSELSLQTTANTDQGVPYMSRHLREAARSAGRGDVTDPTLHRFFAPDWVRFIVATVDVQGGQNARFVVQIMGVGEHLEQCLIDRYSITESEREGPDGRKAPIDPARHAEDWDVLTKRVLNATYRTHHPEREMRVHRMTYDTGGEDGVTDKAYAYYRRLRAARDGSHMRVRPLKGKGGADRVDWVIRETMVGGKQGAGDVPLLSYDPDKIKDMVQNGLTRAESGPGYYHWPDWVAQSFFDELRAEVRLPNGKWSQIKPRNESFDLCVQTRVACIDLGCEKMGFWDHPPAWAQPHERNSGVMTPEARRTLQATAAPPRVVERRMHKSSYMS